MLPPTRGIQRVHLDRDASEVLFGDQTPAETPAVRIDGDRLVVNHGDLLADHTDELILTVTVAP